MVKEKERRKKEYREKKKTGKVLGVRRASRESRLKKDLMILEAERISEFFKIKRWFKKKEEYRKEHP